MIRIAHTFLYSHIISKPTSQGQELSVPGTSMEQGWEVTGGARHRPQTVLLGRCWPPSFSTSVMSHWDFFPSTLGCSFRGCCGHGAPGASRGEGA